MFLAAAFKFRAVFLRCCLVLRAAFLSVFVVALLLRRPLAVRGAPPSRFAEPAISGAAAGRFVGPVIAPEPLLVRA